MLSAWDSRECHLQGMSPAGMSAHPSATGRGASALLAVDPGSPFPLPEMLPGPRYSFTTTCPLHCSFPSFVSSFPSLPAPFPHLLFPFPLEEVILLPCPAHPSPAQPRSRPLPWDSALAGGSASKLLGWQTSTWAHYSRVGDMVITCLRGSGAGPAGRAAPPARECSPGWIQAQGQASAGGDLRHWETGELTPAAEPAPHPEP